MVAGLRPPSRAALRAGCLGFASAPAVTALKLASPSGVVGWLVRHGVDPLLIGSVLHRAERAVGLPTSCIPSFRRRKLHTGMA
jgi:hypothetical protein